MGDRPRLSARTRVAGVIGDPVTHSLSPVIHNAAFDAAGLDWVYVAFPVPRGHGHDAVRAMRSLGIAALNVTMPHKADAASACDELSRDAVALAAANLVVLRDDGRLYGDSTDGAGFVAALREEEIEVTGARCLVLGAGGAARAIVLALGRAGAHVTVAARRLEAAQAAAGLVTGAEAIPLAEAGARVARSEVLVNATPLGMHGELPPFDPAELHGGCFVAETVYSPPETPLLTAARARGARGTSGLGMLVHQAAAAFEQFSGVAAPLEAMREAAEAALAGGPPH